MDQLQEHKRTPSLNNHSLSTTEGKEQTPLSISVIIKQQNDTKVQRNTEEEGRNSAKENEVFIDKQEVPSTNDGTSMFHVLDKTGKVEGRQTHGEESSGNEAQEMLPGWKGFAENIYIRPIVVQSPSQTGKDLGKTSARKNKIDDIRRQMQLRQSSDWVTKHNERLHFKGSLKMGEIPSNTSLFSASGRQSSLSTITTSSKYSKSNESDERLPDYIKQHTSNRKAKIAKGFVCRNWSRGSLSGSQNSRTVHGCSSISIRSYVNISDARWPTASRRSKSQQEIHVINQKASLQTSYKDDIDLHLAKESKTNFKLIERESSQEPSLAQESPTSLTDSINLSDLLFKAVTLNAQSSCTQSHCHCGRKKLQKQNFTFTESMSGIETVTPNVDAMPTVLGAPRSVVAQIKRFPPILSGNDSKLTVDKKVHRPKTLNLTFGGTKTYGTQCNVDKEYSSKNRSSNFRTS